MTRSMQWPGRPAAMAAQLVRAWIPSDAGIHGRTTRSGMDSLGRGFRLVKPASRYLYHIAHGGLGTCRVPTSYGRVLAAKHASPRMGTLGEFCSPGQGRHVACSKPVFLLLACCYQESSLPARGALRADPNQNSNTWHGIPTGWR